MEHLMCKLKAAWEAYLLDSNQVKLLKVVEAHIANDFDPEYELSDEWFKESMETPFLETHRICDIELCGKSFRVLRSSDESETLTIVPCEYPSLDIPGVSYSLTGEKLLQSIHHSQQALEEACEQEQVILDAKLAEKNRKDPVPICSSIIRYIPTGARFEGCGEIIMKTADINTHLKSKAHEQYLYNKEYGRDTSVEADEVLSWTSNINYSEGNETLIPRQWIDRFEHLTYSLLKDKQASVWCSECQKEYTADETIEDVDQFPRGAINGRFFCPKSHKLIEIELLRLF